MTPAAPFPLDRLLAPWSAELVTERGGGPDEAVSGLSLDARAVRPGDLFIACRGTRAHGLSYADQALAAGARAVLHDGRASPEEVRLPAGNHGPVLRLPELPRRVSAIAGRFYGDPSVELQVAAVTGTDGKTSVTHAAARLMESLGVPAGVIGTLGCGPLGALSTPALTTPDPVMLQGILRACADQGVRFVAVEASSHALDQHRLDGVPLDAAVMTGLGRDHLDYHGTMDAYAAAKARLWTDLAPAHVVMNRDDAFARDWLRRLPDAVGYSVCGDAGAATALTDYQAAGTGSRFTVRTLGGRHLDHSTHLPGRFQVANLMAAVAVVTRLGWDEAAAWQAAVRLPAVPGRMEPFDGPEGTPRVVVDYAHTPGALEQALQALRAHCDGRLWVVFGCGGDRDPGKRPEMGRVACQHADHVVLTDDNPRSEDGERILDGIEAGCARTRVPVERIRDRAAAITSVLDRAAAHDLVLVAGKGHEETQEAGGVRHPHSDRACVAARLRGAEEGAWTR